MGDKELNESEREHDNFKKQYDEVQLLLNFIEKHEDESTENFEEVMSAKMKVVDTEIVMTDKVIEKIVDNISYLNKRKKLDTLNMRIWSISTIALALNVVDINNLEPLLFPGIIGISFIAKDSLVKNKYKICYDEPKTVNFKSFINYTILKNSFNIINLLAIIKMKDYYTFDNEGFYRMLMVIISGYLIRFFSKRVEKNNNHIIINEAAVTMLKGKLNGLNDLKESLKIENETEKTKVKTIKK